MYDYVDRPVTALDPGGALFVRATRQWVAAVAERTCPPGAVGPAFDAAHVLPALPHFHMAMMLLNKEARDAVAFAPVSCTHIAEDEAVLLQIIATIGHVSAGRTRATLAMIVLEDAIGPLIAALTGLANCFADASLDLGIAARRGKISGRTIHE